MANSVATLSRRLYRCLLSNSKTSPFSATRRFCSAATTTGDPSSLEEDGSDLDEESAFDPDTDSTTQQSESVPIAVQSESTEQQQQQKRPQRRLIDVPLEKGLDVGIYKAILVGKVGENPMQKILKSGMAMTMFSLGTGGMRNNRRPSEDEDPIDYANRCSVQWHRVAVYSPRLGNIVMQKVRPGTIIYVEGNLETKIFTDPITGIIRRIREIGVRQNGRLVFLGSGGDDQQTSQARIKGVGYY